MQSQQNTQKRVHPFRQAEEQDHLQQVKGLSFRPFEMGSQIVTKPHPWSIEANWEGD